MYVFHRGVSVSFELCRLQMAIVSGHNGYAMTKIRTVDYFGDVLLVHFTEYEIAKTSACTVSFLRNEDILE